MIRLKSLLKRGIATRRRRTEHEVSVAHTARTSPAWGLLEVRRAARDEFGAGPFMGWPSQ